MYAAIPSAAGEFFSPNLSIIALVIALIPPDSNKSIPSITPNAVTIPIPPTVPVNPAATVSVISDKGICTNNAVRNEVKISETNAFKRNLTIDINKNAKATTKITTNNGPVTIRNFLLCFYLLRLINSLSS